MCSKPFLGAKRPECSFLLCYMLRGWASVQFFYIIKTKLWENTRRGTRCVAYLLVGSSEFSPHLNLTMLFMWSWANCLNSPAWAPCLRSYINCISCCCQQTAASTRGYSQASVLWMTMGQERNKTKWWFKCYKLSRRAQWAPRPMTAISKLQSEANLAGLQSFFFSFKQSLS